MWLDRLTMLKKSSGMTSEEISSASGVPFNTVTKIFAGQTADPRLSTIRAIIHSMGYTLDDLDDAHPHTVPQFSDAALRIAHRYDRLDDWGKDLILDLLNRLEIRPMPASSSELAEIIELPHSLLSASAGTGQWLDDDTSDIWEVRLNEHTRKADFAVDVAGDSMEPLYSDGDTVLVHAQPAINLGEIGLYVYRGDGYIKRQGNGCLHSLNPRYPDIVPADGETILCKGLVLGKLDDAWIVSK